MHLAHPTTWSLIKDALWLLCESPPEQQEKDVEVLGKKESAAKTQSRPRHRADEILLTPVAISRAKPVLFFFGGGGEFHTYSTQTNGYREKENEKSVATHGCRVCKCS